MQTVEVESGGDLQQTRPWHDGEKETLAGELQLSGNSPSQSNAFEEVGHQKVQSSAWPSEPS